MANQKKRKSPKSYKADGTPKKRWTPQERAERGHESRKRGGRRTSSGLGTKFEDQNRYESSQTFSRGSKRGVARHYNELSDDTKYQQDSRRGSSSARKYDDRYQKDYRSRDDRFNRDDRFGRDDRFSRDNRFGRGDSRNRDDRFSSGDRFSRGDSHNSDRNDFQGRAMRNGKHSFHRQDERFASRKNKFQDYDDSRSSGHQRFADRSFAHHSQPKIKDEMTWGKPDVAPIDLASAEQGIGFSELGVRDELVAALVAKGIRTPFPIQKATIPDALNGRDILGRGRTGSGKTFSFGIPTLSRIADKKSKSGKPKGLILAPARELALQVADNLSPLAGVLGLELTLVAGGMSYGPQLKAFDRGVDLVVATPGRLIDLMKQGVADLSEIDICVLDEADLMADMGFLPDMTTILDAVPANGQRMLFSATLDGDVNTLVKRYLHNPVVHEVDSGKASVTTMRHEILYVSPHNKNQVTAQLASRKGKTMIFVRTQRGADRVAEQLRQVGVMAGPLHGGLTQGARTRVFNAFKNGDVPVLVATDVAARGLDVPGVSLVLQADPPEGSKDYLHRAGRTARAGESGVVLSIVLPHQRKMMRRITGQAGVKSKATEVTPNDQELQSLADTYRYSGIAIPDEDFQLLVAPPQQRRRGNQRRPRSFGGRGRRR